MPLSKDIILHMSTQSLNPIKSWKISALTDLLPTLKHIVWICVWAGWEPHRERVGERERELCLILLSAMVGQIGARQAKERDSKQHLPQTDHSMGLGGVPKRGERDTYGLESSIEKETHVTDIFPNDLFESKAPDLRLLMSCLVV